MTNPAEVVVHHTVPLSSGRACWVCVVSLPSALQVEHITRYFAQSVEIYSTGVEMYFSSRRYFAFLLLLRIISHKLEWFSHILCLCSVPRPWLWQLRDQTQVPDSRLWTPLCFNGHKSVPVLKVLLRSLLIASSCSLPKF